MFCGLGEEKHTKLGKKLKKRKKKPHLSQTFCAVLLQKFYQLDPFATTF